MAKTRGDKIERYFAEHRSGKSLDREELTRLRAEVKAGRVARLYVFRLDRLTRSGIKDTLQVVEELREHEVELVSVADGFALEGPTAEIVLAVMAWAARMERLAINERISAARDRLEALGIGWGRPARMSEAERAKASEMRERGLSLRDIAQRLGVPRATLARSLKRGPSRKVGAVPTKEKA